MASLALVWELLAIDKASGTFNRVAASADRAAASTAKAETGVLGFSKKAVAALGALATVDTLGHFVKDAAQFQRSMLLIQTQAGASAKQVKVFSREILNLAPKVGASPEDLATSLYHVQSALTKLGATGPQKLKAVQIAAEGAKVGMTSVEDTTNSLTAALASGIVTYGQAGKAMGALNAIVGAGDMHFSDLNEALSTGLLVTMKTFGVSLNDTGGALALFGDNSIRGAEAATKLRMAVQDLSKPAAKADDFLSKINLSSAKLRATLQDHGLDATLHLLSDRLTQFGVTGSKVGGFLEDAFTKKAGTGLAILITRLKQFDEARAAVQKGADSFGADWAATTHTAAFAFDKLKSEFDVFAITVGDKLLPAVSSAATWVGTNLPKAFHTLGQILGPVVHIIADVFVAAWHALGAILKPVFSALSGIGNFLASHRMVFTSVATAVLAMWGAFKLLVGVRAIILGAIGTINKIGAAVELAAIKIKAFGVANSLAVAGIGALVGVGITVWQQMAAESAKVEAEFKAEVDAITATLNKQNGAITDNTKHWLIHKLAITGMYDYATKLGVSFDTVTRAALGQKPAMDALTAASKKYYANTGDFLNFDQLKTVGINSYSTAIGAAQQQIREQIAAEKQQKEAQRQGSTVTVQHTRVTQVYGDALRESANAVRTTTTALHTHTGATDADRAATMLLKEQTNALKDALSGVANRLNNAAAAIAWQQSLNDLTSTIKQNKGAIDGHSAAALADKAALIGDLQTLVTHAQQMLKNGASIDKVTGYLKTQYGELRDHATAAGADGKHVDALAKKLGLLPKQLNLRLKLFGIDTAISALGNLRRLEQGITTDPGFNGQRAPSLKAAGGAIFGPGGPVGDKIPIMASDGEHMWTADEVNKAGGQGAMYRMRAAVRAGLLKFAGGGAILSDVVKAGFSGNAARIMAAIVEAESGGNARAHNYNPSTGDDSYGLAQINLYGSLRSRLQQFHLGSPSALYDPLTNLRVAFALSGGGRNFSPWTTYTSGAYQQFLGATGAVTGAVAGAAAGGGGRTSPLGRLNTLLGAVTGNAPGSPISASGFSWREFASQLTRAAKGIYGATGLSGKQRDRLVDRLQSLERQGLRIEKQMQNSAQRQLKRLSPSSGAQSVLGSLKSIEHGLIAAGLSKSVVNGLSKDNQSVFAAVKAFNEASRHLASARADTQAARSAVTGSFDITSAGANPITGKITGGSILAQAKQAAARAKLWVHGIKRLAGMKIFPAGYLRALIGQGPAGLDQVQALLSLGTSGLKELAAQERALKAYGTEAGNIAARRFDGGTVKQWENRRKQWENKFDHRMDRIEHILDHYFGKFDSVTETQLVAIVNHGQRKNKRRT